ncbi:tRNA-uridine aminocarboxypropyltransferase [Alteromonas sp. ASW11-130]|uniref:tRNA-uridine aminocarboxypropyltransferase n=1 Tax=Alteromonas sp. ASW11-130 TaxID=3015775 RepID=UPI0022428432|nr:tRNA-uridine aminocarboxypropyltransferase [Alteromonas sp. ASW11-130]MCW8093408.1 DTW domain-containing protein [Alteromonas sp. ASW11-130]
MRSYCSMCHFPASTCLCAHISRTPCPLSIVVLQHNNEAGHAKNTVRLLKLAMPEIRVITGRTPSDFTDIALEVTSGQSGVIYPTENSTALEEYEKRGEPTLLKQLIFIDGSWPQAYGIWQANTWLHALPQFHFNDAPKSEYEIRHVRMKNSLSTLEAVSYAISTITATDTSPLLKLQLAFQQKWRSPKSHRRN